MGISKWELFKRIEKIPNDKYGEVKDYLDGLIEVNESSEVILDKESKNKLNKSLLEYDEGEYLTFDQVFEKSDDTV